MAFSKSENFPPPYPDIIKLATKLEYSSHNASILWTLKNYFCMSSYLLKSTSFRRGSPLPETRRIGVILRTFQIGPATPLTLTIRTLNRWLRVLCTWSQTSVQGFVDSCSVSVLQTLVLD